MFYFYDSKSNFMNCSQNSLNNNHSQARAARVKFRARENVTVHSNLFLGGHTNKTPFQFYL